jgi:tetratricopeptide (TPR) repeat protein
VISEEPNVSQSQTVSGSPSDTSPRDPSPAAPSAQPFSRVLLRNVPPVVIIGPAVVLVGVLAWWFLAGRTRVGAEPRTVSELAEAGRLEEAEALARAYLAKNPRSSEGRLSLAKVLFAQRKLPDAADLLESLHETVDATTTLQAGALLRAGTLWKESGYRRKAEGCWKRVLQFNAPEALELPLIQQEARRQLAGLYAEERRTAEFRRITWEAFENDPPERRYEALASRIRYTFEMVAPEVAEPALRQAVAADPSDVSSRRALGLYLMEMGQVEQARAELRRCVTERPQDPLVWEAWLDCLNRLGDQSQYRLYLDSMPKEAEHSPLCWRLRCRLLGLLGRHEEALQAALKAVELDPWSSDNRYQLVQALSRLGKTEEAQKHMERTKELQGHWQKLRDTFDQFRAQWELMTDVKARVEMALQLAQLCELLGWIRDAYGWYGVALHYEPTHPGAIAAREKLQPHLSDPKLPY